MMHSLRTEDLQVASTYCVNNAGRTMNLSTSICYGIMRNLADNYNDYVEVGDRVVKPRFMHSLRTTTDFSGITSSNEELILISNPLKQVAVSNYLWKVYINNIPSLHIGPCMQPVLVEMHQQITQIRVQRDSSKHQNMTATTN